jgi:molybdopterin synthase catalytic subunit
MITVKLFALLKEKAGSGELRIPDGPSTVGELLREVSSRYPALSEIISGGRLLISVNEEFAKQDTPLKDGDEVGLMPPFSGGGPEGTGNVRVQEGPFSLDEEVARIKKASSSIGAVVTFLGTTRDISREKQVSKLDFEHYPGMAERKLAEIRERAIREFGVIEVVIIHRIGTLPVGENIVLIAVAAVHRDEAFRACRFCIDELKRIAPIWKRETTPDGESWVEEHP